MTIVLSDPRLRVACEPEHGAVVTELAPAGRENLLWRRATEPAALPERVRTRRDADDFDTEVFVGGWFGMFPTAGIPGAADADRVMHGDLPRVSWRVVRHSATTLTLSAEARPGFALTRALSLVDGTLTVRTEACNRTGTPLAVSFGEHPCLAREAFAGGRVRMAAAGAVVPAEASSPGSVSVLPGSRAEWPMLPGAHGGLHDLSVIPREPDATHDHVLVDVVGSMVAVESPRLSGALEFRFDPKATPHLLLWRHFLPADTPWDGDVFSPEFLSLPGRSLDDPGAREALRVVEPGATISWSLAARWLPSTHTRKESHRADD